VPGGSPEDGKVEAIVEVSAMISRLPFDANRPRVIHSASGGPAEAIQNGDGR
jgi:hypothetical protein